MWVDIGEPVSSGLFHDGHLFFGLTQSGKLLLGGFNGIDPGLLNVLIANRQLERQSVVKVDYQLALLIPQGIHMMQRKSVVG